MRALGSASLRSVFAFAPWLFTVPCRPPSKIPSIITPGLPSWEHSGASLESMAVPKGYGQVPEFCWLARPGGRFRNVGGCPRLSRRQRPFVTPPSFLSLTQRYLQVLGFHGSFFHGPAYLYQTQRICLQSGPPRMPSSRRNLHRSQLSHPPISQRLARRASVALAAALLFAPLALHAQSVSITSDSSKASDRWLHVRVDSTESKNETVRVNVPLDMAEKALPAINKDRLHNGKVRFNDADMNGVNLKTILQAVSTPKEREFLT